MNFRMRIVTNIFVKSFKNVSGEISSSAIKTVTRKEKCYNYRSNKGIKTLTK